MQLLEHKWRPKSSSSWDLHITKALKDLPQSRFLYENIVSQTAKLLFETTELQRDPMFHFMFPSESELKNFASTRRISFAPELMKILKSPTPPTLEDLKSLPKLPTKTKVWAVYLLVLEREGEKPEIYIGCGTESIYGVKSRFNQYDNENTLPKEVKDRLENHQYKITFQGLLGWTPLPLDDNLLHFKTRTLFLAFEATFSILLWAMLGCDETEYNMPVPCHWDVRDMPYKGCCTHVSFSKPVLGEDAVFTKEQLQPLKDIRERLANERRIIREAHRKMSGRKAASAKKTKKKALDTSRFECCVCGYNGADKYALKTHIRAQKHCTILTTLAKNLAHHASAAEGMHRDNARRALVTFAGLSESIDKPFCKTKVYSKLVELVGLVVEHAGRRVDQGHGQAVHALGRLVKCGESMPALFDAEEDKTRSKKSAAQAERCKLARESGRFTCIPCRQAFGTQQQLDIHCKGLPHLTGKPHFKKRHGQKLGEIRTED